MGHAHAEELAPAPSGRTPFGDWLDMHGITYAAAARVFDVTRSYMQGLGTGKSSPTIKFAAQIEKWSRDIDPKNPVTVASWVVPEVG